MNDKIDDKTYLKVKLVNRLKNNKVKKNSVKKPLPNENYKSKEFICRNLLTSIRILNRIIKQNGISVSKGDCFTDEEYSAIKGYIQSRRKAINRQSKKIESVNLPTKIRAKRKSKPGSGVYGRIEKYGGVGKLIYIRSR